MRIEIRDIAADGAQNQVRLCTYIQDASDELMVNDRPIVVICPGGGYTFTSDREADPVAMQFMAMGFHTAILRYSVAPAEYPEALLELGSSLNHIRKNAKRWHVDPDKIILLGFSAGGHLAASYACFWEESFVATKLGITDKEVLRPNGLILCYPVISSGEYAHYESFENLLGAQKSNKELWNRLSLEHQVSESVPRTFIWHTCEDEMVPVQNTLLWVNALLEKHIPVECHIFEKGEHGLSLADWKTRQDDGSRTERSCVEWITLVKNWMNYYLE